MIRQATPADISQLINLGARMHAESRFSVLGYDRRKVAALFAHLLATDQFIEVIELDGEIVGGFAGFVTEHWASQDLVSYDCGLFIAPDSRGGFDAARLIKRFRVWAIARGARMVTLGVNTGVHPERTARLMEAVGFERIGYLYEGGKPCAPA